MVVQLNLTPEIEVFYILFERSLSIFTFGDFRSRKVYSSPERPFCPFCPFCQVKKVDPREIWVADDNFGEMTI